MLYQKNYTIPPKRALGGKEGKDEYLYIVESLEKEIIAEYNNASILQVLTEIRNYLTSTV